MLLSLLSQRTLTADSRDAYGFTVRPQHLQRFREYDNIYKEEEEERRSKWKSFLKQHESAHLNSIVQQDISTNVEVSETNTHAVLKASEGSNESSEGKSAYHIPTECDTENVVLKSIETGTLKMQMWAEVRSSLNPIENITSLRADRKRKMKDKQATSSQNHLPSIKEVEHSIDDSRENIEGEIDGDDIVNSYMDLSGMSSVKHGDSPEPFFPWKEELESLVRGGVPRDLRGEVWQAFVGVRARRVERYYQDLLDLDHDATNSHEQSKTLSHNNSRNSNKDRIEVPEKCRKQIEKDLPRTFPGHPALNEDGRNSLRRLLIAYARHNPAVGYCQAMNFFAGILLLMMPEENAFWTLVGIIDDYFDGYFSPEMIESQVDQLVFEDLMRERFPKLVNHLDFLGVEVAWISGPWFLSIFVHMLPWESVLRVWDVLLFEGNRVMLFRTALALMDLYGPTLLTSKDAGDAITLLQSLAGSTFDSSQLVLIACMGFSTVTEDKLQQLREKNRPSVLEAVEERSKGSKVSKGYKKLASKLYSFKQDPESLVKRESRKDDFDGITHLESQCSSPDEFSSGVAVDSEVDSLPDLQDQVVWMKVELCRLLEEKRSATHRAEELETALMEMAKQDNRRQLSARLEQLEQEVAELQQALSDKNQQESAMLQVLMRLEQEQKITESARICAEQDATAQRYALAVLQEKYEKAIASVAQMEKRVVMAESMLEATLQYESGQVKASSPRVIRPNSPQDTTTRRAGLLSFGLGWRDRNKEKPANFVVPNEESKTTNEVVDARDTQIVANGHQQLDM